MASAEFRFIPAAALVSPADGSTYTSPGGHTYTVTHLAGTHSGFLFTPSDADPIAAGESDLFTFRVLRATLQDDTVLWNNAVSNLGTEGRIDLRLSLCVQLLVPTALGAEACYSPGADARSWDVTVRWQAHPQAPDMGFDVYRLVSGTSEAVRVNVQPIYSGRSRHAELTDTVAAGSVTGYRIQPLDGGQPVDVSVVPCGVVVHEAAPQARALLVLAILLGAALLLSRLAAPRRG
jgi:hypothetical protein